MTQGPPTLTAERDGALLVVQLARPAKRNAMNLAMAAELMAVLDELSGVRALVLTGDERAFSAGADLSEMLSGVPEGPTWHDVLPALAGLPIPTIAAIEGWCLGGGLELALTCDLRVAARDAQLGTPEVQRGIFPGGGGTQRLARLLGAARAKELMFLGDAMSGAEAAAWGLVNRVTEPGAALATALELAQRLAAAATVAIATIKGLVDDGLDVDLATGLALERSRGQAVIESTDAREGVTAFLERRPARFEGR